MNIDYILLAILIIALVITFFYGGKLLKGDNHFFYQNGRAMRSLDISLSGEKDTYNKRIRLLTPETVVRFRKWLYLDFAFMPGLYVAVGILCYFASRLYHGENWRDFFTLLIVGQGVALIADVIENFIVLRSLRTMSMPVNMSVFNNIIGLKLFFPILGVFVTAASGILWWFRFLNSKEEPISALLFIVPPFVVFLVMMLRKKGKTA